MESAWPLWALPFWTLGVPLICAVIEVIKTPKTGASTAHTPAAGIAGSSQRPLASVSH